MFDLGIDELQPLCPSACRGVLSGAQLNCSTTMMMSGGPMVETSGSCYAADTEFLASMAWCIKRHCPNLKLWEIEEWWYHNIPGKQIDQPDPKWTYQETLEKMPTAPDLELAQGSPMNKTVIVSDHDYELQAQAMLAFGEVEVNHSKYGYVERFQLRNPVR